MKVVPLPKGIKFQKTSMSLIDAEWIESRKYQVEDLARFYGVPPSILGSTGALPRSNVEESFREFLMIGLRPWLVLWENQINIDVFGPDGDLFMEFNLEGLLRGDMKSRFAAWRTALGGAPFMTRNEVRRKESMNPMDGGDELHEPVNVTRAGSEPEAEGESR